MRVRDQWATWIGILLAAVGAVLFVARSLSPPEVPEPSNLVRRDVTLLGQPSSAQSRCFRHCFQLEVGDPSVRGKVSLRNVPGSLAGEVEQWAAGQRLGIWIDTGNTRLTGRIWAIDIDGRPVIPLAAIATVEAEKVAYERQVLLGLMGGGILFAVIPYAIVIATRVGLIKEQRDEQ